MKFLFILEGNEDLGSFLVVVICLIVYCFADVVDRVSVLFLSDKLVGREGLVFRELCRVILFS